MMILKFKREKNKQLGELVQTLCLVSSTQEMKEFLESILTPKELIEIPNRLQIVKMLKQGVSQHEVAQKLGVGIATVERGAQEIKKGKFGNV
jgi:TrpR family transcriptional regulator, trp operon repressor